MDAAQLIDHVAAEGPLLAAAADRAGWDAAVPATDWTVRELVTHIGGVHRWAATVIGGASQEQVEAAGTSVGQGPADDDLLDWFVDGHAALVATLRAAPSDLQAFTFLPADSPLHFWARRQAHEISIHRVDAEGAAKTATSFDSDFAQDGIDELLRGFAVRRKNAIDRPGTLELRPTDTRAPRLIIFGGERIETADPTGAADAVVSGTSSELYRWLWNRPVEVQVSGDAEIAGLWRSVQVTWG